MSEFSVTRRQTTTAASSDDIDKMHCSCCGILLILFGVVLLGIAALQLVDYKNWILSQNPCYCNPYANGPGAPAGWIGLNSVQAALVKAVLPLVAGILLVWYGVHKMNHAKYHAARARRTVTAEADFPIGVAEESRQA